MEGFLESSAFAVSEVENHWESGVAFPEMERLQEMQTGVGSGDQPLGFCHIRSEVPVRPAWRTAEKAFLYICVQFRGKRRARDIH